MKENKRFFDRNYLNKGHLKSEEIPVSEVSKLGRKYQNFLPPIELMEHYEELYPGTMEKLLQMTAQEQDNRHLLEMSKVQQREKTLRLEKILVFIFAITLIIASMFFGQKNNIFLAFIVIILVIFSARNLMKNNNLKYPSFKKKNRRKY